MSQKSVRTFRKVVRTVATLVVTLFGFVTSFLFALWLSRTLTPRGEWLQNTLTAFGFPVAWLLLTLLYVTLMVGLMNWLFRTIWPKPPGDEHER